MELKIYWTDFAEKELVKIFDYYKSEASIKVAKNVVERVVEATMKLSSHPELGSIEELLNSREQEFRCLISSNFKIIYFKNLDKNRIEVVDVFDTRQNPIKIKRIG